MMACCWDPDRECGVLPAGIRKLAVRLLADRKPRFDQVGTCRAASRLTWRWIARVAPATENPPPTSLADLQLEGEAILSPRLTQTQRCSQKQAEAGFIQGKVRIKGHVTPKSFSAAK